MLTMNAYDPMVPLSMGTMTDSPTEFNAVLSPIGQAHSPANFDVESFTRYVRLLLAQPRYLPKVFMVESLTQSSCRSLPAPTSNPLKRSFSAYEENYSPEVGSNCDHSSLIEPVTPDISLDRDNKLLHFSTPSYKYALLDYTYRRISISLSAQLHGMFFLAEPVWSGTGELLSAPRGLTCYRRNLFSLSGSVSLPRSLRYILSEHGEQIPIVAQELELSASESIEGNAVKIISVPWKTPAGATPAPEEKPEKEPSSIPLDLVTGMEFDPDYATIPISWKRLQFRVATANNGRRKELQQHFTIRLKLVATLSTGQKTSLCEATSGPIIVRGRSPRNFQAKKEIPVGTGNSGSRRHSSYNKSSPSSTSAPVTATTPALAPTIKSEAAVNYDPSPFLSPDFLDWKLTDENHGPMTSMPPSAYTMPPPMPPYTQPSPGVAGSSTSRPALAPINLSLEEDESKKTSDSATPPSKRQRLTQPSARTPSFSLKEMTHNEDTTDLFYEYFPLGFDDWQEPVDAVYRPHVVHHINFPDLKTKFPSNRSKRYFSSKSASP